MGGDRRGQRAGRTTRGGVPRAGAIALLAAAAALLVVPAGPRNGGVPASSAPASLAAFVNGTSCAGAAAPTRVTGLVRSLGGPAPGPDLSNLTVGYAYRYQVTYEPKGGVPSAECETRTVSVAPAPTGAFAIAASVPASFCTADSCSNFTGPYGPASVALLGPAPGGYEERGGLAGTEANLTLVYALQSPNATTASGLATVSPDAAFDLDAAARAADGERAPLRVSYAWTLDGAGWSAWNASDGALATLVAAAGAAPATVTVWANGTYNGTVVHAQPQRIGLTAVGTSIDSAGIDPTALDRGSNATVTVRGVGAAGYAYTARVWPGLGAPAVLAPCASTAAPGGEVAVECSAPVTYDSTGTAQPSVELTNGYSNADETLSPVAVAAGPAVTVAAPSPTARAGLPFAVTVTTVPGTGTTPYAPACLDPGFGSPACANATGASWTFSIVYPRPGVYELRAWTTDATGLRAVAAAPVVAVAPLALHAGAAPNEATAGRAVAISATVGGGALPLAYWWNASGPSSLPLAAGDRTTDGGVSLRFVPTAAGPVTVALTVEDALGARLSATWRFAVDAGPVATLAVATRPAGATAATAGSPFPLSLLARDASGTRAEGFAGALALTVRRDAGAAPVAGWVNDSARGWSRALPANGTLAVDGSAWADGYLNLTIAVRGAGEYRANARVNATLVATAAWTVGSDPDHWRLFDPEAAPAAGRAHATLWRIADRFGNPVPAGTEVTVRTEFDGTVRTGASPVRTVGATQVVWVNYSVPVGAAGEAEALSPAGQVLWGPVAVASPAPVGSSAGGTLLSFFPALAAAVGGGGALAAARRARRRHGVRRARIARPEASESELRRLAEGRAAVERALRERGPLALDELRRRGVGLGTDAERSEIAEWVASLVAEGTVRAFPGPDGAPRFGLADATPVTGPPAPRVQVDPALLERALARAREDADQPGARPTRS